MEKVYAFCCGKTVCAGCAMASNEEIHKGNIKDGCAFCRVPLSNGLNETLKRVYKRMELGDHNAFHTLGCKYNDGEWGFAVNQPKALELWHQATELGSISAHHNLAMAHQFGQGVRQDSKKGLHHARLAAIGGHEIARYNLGVTEEHNGNIELAMKHFMFAARAGYDCLKKVGDGYRRGDVTKDDYAKTLRINKFEMT